MTTSSIKAREIICQLLIYKEEFYVAFILLTAIINSVSSSYVIMFNI